MRNGYGNLTQALLQMGGPSQAQTQVDLMGAERDMQLAQALMSQQYVPNSGALGAVAQLFGGIAGRRVQTGANERFSDALERQFAIEREKYAQALQAQQAQEERAYQRDIDKIRAKEKAEQEFATVTPTTRQRDLEAAGFKPGSPQYQEAMNRLLTQSKAPVVNVNSGEQWNPFEKELAKKDADQYQLWRTDAVNASGVLSKLDALEQISANLSTGKTQEALAIAGQYFGTSAGADMQSFNKIVGPLVLLEAQKLKPLSNSDVNTVREMMPAFGSDPRANRIIIDILRKGSEAQIGLFKEADAHVRERRSLQGFQPSVVYQPREEAPAGGGAVRSFGGKRYRLVSGDPNDPESEWEAID